MSHSFMGVVLNTIFLFPLKAINVVRINNGKRNPFSNERDCLDVSRFCLFAHFFSQNFVNVYLLSISGHDLTEKQTAKNQLQLLPSISRARYAPTEEERNHGSLLLHRFFIDRYNELDICTWTIL